MGKNRIWFDTATQELRTETELMSEYITWIVETAKEQGDYIKENPKDFTFEAWIVNCTTPWNGTLVEVKNAKDFRKIVY